MSFSQTKPKSRTRRNKEVDYLGVQPLLERTKRGARVKAEEAKLELIKKLAEEKIMKDFDKKQNSLWCKGEWQRVPVRCGCE